MTYLRRSAKYFVQLILLLGLVLGLLMALHRVPTHIAGAFREGWKSVSYILGLFLLMGAIYPRFGYGKRKISALGDPAQHKEAILRAMQARGYVPANDEATAFHLASPLSRATRLWEDTLTLTPVVDGYELEGLLRDVTRVAWPLQNALSHGQS